MTFIKSTLKRVLQIGGLLFIIGFLIQWFFDPFASFQNQKRLDKLQGELNKEESKWESKDIMDYSFEMKQWSPFVHCYAKVLVNHGEIVEISAMYLPPIAGTPTQGGLTILERQKWDEEPCKYSEWTITKIFDRVQWSIDHTKNITFLVFDPELGFVTEFRGDDNFNKGLLVPQMFDTEFSYTFSNFQHLDSTSP